MSKSTNPRQKKTPRKKSSAVARGSTPRDDPDPEVVGEAAVTVARAWLIDADFREDPANKNPDRVEILGPGWDGVSQEHYVDVRIYVPQTAIDSEIAAPPEERAA